MRRLLIFTWYLNKMLLTIKKMFLLLFYLNMVLKIFSVIFVIFLIIMALYRPSIRGPCSNNVQVNWPARSECLYFTILPCFIRAVLEGRYKRLAVCSWITLHAGTSLRKCAMNLDYLHWFKKKKNSRVISEKK